MKEACHSDEVAQMSAGLSVLEFAAMYEENLKTDWKPPFVVVAPTQSNVDESKTYLPQLPALSEAGLSVSAAEPAGNTPMQGYHQRDRSSKVLHSSSASTGPPDQLPLVYKPLCRRIPIACQYLQTPKPDLPYPPLKAKHLVWLIPQLGQHTALDPSKQALGALERLLHGRRPAHQHLGVLVLLVGRTDPRGLEDLLGDESLGVRRRRARLGHDVDDLDAAGVLGLHGVELVGEEEVLVRVDAPDERDACLVGGVLEDAARELVHGRDAGAAGDHGHVLVLVGRPLELGDGRERERVAGLERVDVRALLAAGVVLDHELDEALFVCVTC